MQMGGLAPGDEGDVEMSGPADRTSGNVDTSGSGNLDDIRRDSGPGKSMQSEQHGLLNINFSSCRLPKKPKFVKSGNICGHLGEQQPGRHAARQRPPQQHPE